MYAIELLSRQPDQAITALAFAVLKNIQGRKDADPVNLITRKNVFIFRSFAAQHDIIDNEIVALSRQGANRVVHTAQGPLTDRPGSDDHRRFAVFNHGLIGEAVGMILIGLGQHRHETIHGHVQKGLGGYGLQRLGQGTFARAANAVEKNDPGFGLQMVSFGMMGDDLAIVNSTAN